MQLVVAGGVVVVMAVLVGAVLILSRTSAWAEMYREMVGRDMPPQTTASMFWIVGSAALATLVAVVLVLVLGSH